MKYFGTIIALALTACGSSPAQIDGASSSSGDVIQCPGCSGVDGGEAGVSDSDGSVDSGSSDAQADTSAQDGSTGPSCSSTGSLATCAACCQAAYLAGWQSFCQDVVVDCLNAPPNSECSGYCTTQMAMAYCHGATGGGMQNACNQCEQQNTLPVGACTQTLPASCSGDVQCQAYATCFSKQCDGKS